MGYTSDNIFLSLSFTILFVGVIYLPFNQGIRDDPTIIKRRLNSLAIVSLICCLLCINLAGFHNMLRLLLLEFSKPAFTFRSNLVCTFRVLLMDVSLYLGPLLCDIVDGEYSEFWKSGSFGQTIQQRWVRYRNYLLAPLIEEIVFRGCFHVLWCRQSERNICGNVCFVSGVMFSLAHFHHLIRHVREEKKSLEQSIVIISIQMLYTFLFGYFSSLVLLATGSLIAVIINHMFFNFMQLPNFGYFRAHSHRMALIIATFVGIGAFTIQLKLLF